MSACTPRSRSSSSEARTAASSSGVTTAPRGVHPLDRLDGVLQVGQRLRLRPDDPAGQAARDEGPGDLQHLAEAAGHHQPDPGALALQDRVRRDRGAVQHVRDLGRARSRRPHRPSRCRRSTPTRLVLRRGRGLGPVGGAGRLVHEQQVGERAADVHAEPIGHASSSSDHAVGAEAREARRGRGRAGRGRSRRCARRAPARPSAPARACRTAGARRSASRSSPEVPGAAAARSTPGRRSAGRRACPWPGRCGPAGTPPSCSAASSSSACRVRRPPGDHARPARSCAAPRAEWVAYRGSAASSGRPITAASRPKTDVLVGGDQHALPVPRSGRRCSARRSAAPAPVRSRW